MPIVNTLQLFKTIGCIPSDHRILNIACNAIMGFLSNEGNYLKMCGNFDVSFVSKCIVLVVAIHLLLHWCQSLLMQVMPLGLAFLHK